MRTLLISFSILILHVSGHSQASSLPAPKPYFSAIIVSDIAISIEWYTKNFGLEIVNQVENSERGFKQANLKRGSTWLELLELNNARSQSDLLANLPAKTKVEGYFKFGFTVSEFDEWIKFLTAVEVNLYGSVVEDPNSGKRMIIVLDPDGNRIQLFEE
ncbi:MAG: VOC family protein [Cyclobacteriaceae bacterium]